jgi:hypothetical protein
MTTTYRSILALSVGLIVSASVSVPAATIAWTNLAGGNWSAPANWSPNQLPGASDNVFITSNGFYMVTMDVNATIGTLTVGSSGGEQMLAMGGSTLQINGAGSVGTYGYLSISGGAIQGPGVLTVNGRCDWWGGALAGGAFLTVGSGGDLNILNGFNVQGVLTNLGTVNWQGGSIQEYNNTAQGGTYTGQIWNALGAVWNIECNQWLEWGSGAEQFHNAGLLTKTLSFGTSYIQPYLDNTGTVQAQTGTVEVYEGSGMLGAFEASSNAAIVFNGTYTVWPGVNLSGPGSFQFVGGSLTILTNPLPNLQLTGGTVYLDASFEGGAITNLSLNGALLAATNTVTGQLSLNGGGVSGNLTIGPGGVATVYGNLSGVWMVAQGVLNWGNGTFGGDSNSWMTVSANGTLNILGSCNIESALTNQGTVNWLGGNIQEYNNTAQGGTYTGQIWNALGAVWNIECNQWLQSWSGAEQFHNAGLLRKSVTSGQTYIQPYLDNSGTVEAQSGTLELYEGSNLGGHFVADAGAAIDLDGTFAIAPSDNFSGAGVCQVTGGTVTLLTNLPANLQINGANVWLDPSFQGGAITNLTLEDATLNGTNIVAGTLTLNNANLLGVLTIASNAVANFNGVTEQNGGSAITVAAGGALNILNWFNVQGVLTNLGTVNWQGGSIQEYNNTAQGGNYTGSIWNQAGATWNIECDQGLQWNWGAEQFHNAGLLRKTAGAGQTSIEVNLDNAGLMDIQSGVIALMDSYTLEPGGAVNFGIYSDDYYGQLNLASTASAALNGYLTVELNPAFLVEPGATFNLVSYQAESGSFVNSSPSSELNSQETYGATEFSVTVVSPLEIEPIAVQYVVQGSSLSVPVTALDADAPPAVVTFSLVSKPAGMTINSSTGLISWPPTPSQAGTTNTVVVAASDNGTPSLSDTNSFVVIVVPSHANVAPALPNVPTQTISELATLVVTNTASETDSYASLACSLAAAPAGAAINGNGIITWTPSQAQSHSTNTFTTIVSNTDPYAVNTHLSATNTFLVVVKELNMAPVIPPIPAQAVNELALLTVNAAAGEPNINATTIGYGLINPPTGAAINSSGVFTWMPAQTQSPSTNIITVIATNNDPFDTVNPKLTGTNSFTVFVSEVNVAPTLPTLGPQSVNELTQISITNTATEPNPHATTSGYGLSAPAGAAISPSGIITWTPAQTQSPGTNTFITIVTNNDPYDLVHPQLLSTNFITVVVKEVNVAPTLSSVIPSQTVNELATLTVTNAATESNIHATTTGYALLNAPSNAAISPAGVITWTPSQSQSPSTNTLTTVVSNSDSFDTVHPVLTFTNFFTVFVREVNVGPVLGVIPAQTVNESTLLTVTNAATDSNNHAVLSYALVAPPAGAAINAATGVITWTPSQSQSPGANVLTTIVTATDSYDIVNPQLMATNSFTVIVTEVNIAPSMPSISLQTVNELATLTVASTATEPNFHAITTGYGLINPPAGAAVNETGIFTWTPSQTQSPGTNIINVVATNDDIDDPVHPQLTSTNTFTVVVKEVNVAPVLGALGTQYVNELTTLTVTNAATQSNIHATTTGYSLSGPSGAAISPSGVITWTPSQSQSPGTNLFTTLVTNSDPFDTVHPTLTATNTFTVIVVEVNMAPVLPTIPTQTVNELATLNVTNTASEPNNHATTIGYGLINCPTNAAINASGVFTWTPSQSQSPGTNVITVIATNNDVFDTVHPQLRATNLFTVIVQEVNQAPTLPVISTRTVAALSLLTVTNAAAETNIHAATAGYTLVNPPAGLAISAAGVITWTPSLAQNNTTNLVTTIVTNTDLFDPVNPHLTATNTFTIIVAQPSLSLSRLTVSNGLFHFTFNTATEAAYVVQSSTDLIHWADVLVLDPGPGGPVTVEDPNVLTFTSRFYRVNVTNP